MDFTSPTVVKKICHDYGIAPTKRRGQNFLIDKNILHKIIKAADISSSDYILEVGPGLGSLTSELIQRAKKVVAVELDKKFVQVLKDNFSEQKNLIIAEGDILKVDLDQWFNDYDFKVVANIPYNITSPLIFKFLSSPPRPKEVILMMQKEVVERILAKPPRMNLLALMAQFYGLPDFITKVSRNSFWPKPQVDSAVLKISVFKKNPHITKDFQEKFFWRLIKAGFSSKRKQLVNNLVKKLDIAKDVIFTALKEAGLSEKIRAEELSIEDWVRICNLLAK